MIEAEILIVSASEGRRGRLRELLQGFGYAIECCASGGEATERLRRGGIGAALVEWELPDGEGTAFIASWSVDAELDGVQCVLVTGNFADDHLRAALASGAVDYLVRPVGEVELFARVGVALRIHRLTRRLVELSDRDPLTGLHDRRWADRRLVLELERCARYRRSMSVGLVDLDRLADLNAAHGHHVGDLVLRQFADLARAELRRPDVCARFEGQRFVVIFPETGLAQSAQALERMRRAAGELRWGVDGEVELTFSAGVAAPTSLATSTIELIALAEKALHAAKAAGRDRILRAGEIPAPRLELITS